MSYSNEFTMNGSTFLFNEYSTEDDYLYEIGIDYENKNAVVIITKYGVSLFFDNGSITSNITPCGIFPDKNKLSNDNLKHILSVWQNNGYEGKYYSKKEMKSFYGQFIADE